MASTGEAWRLGRRPALDGLRGIAVLLVLAAHSTEMFTTALGAAGRVGVTIFFTLSGFLITALLLEERALTGRISLTSFYGRRARRLLPALAAMLTVVVALGVVAPAAVAAVVFYYGNWYGAAGHPFTWLNHTWSLAIEEQFYLVWPLVVIAVRSRRVLLVVAVGGAAASVAARAVLWDGSVARAMDLGWWTHTAADPILLGCALAVVLHGSRGVWAAAGAPWTVGPLLAAATAAGLAGGLAWRTVWMPLVVALFAAGLLAQSRTPGWLASRPLVAVGRRSYGLYLWHVPVLNVVTAFGLPAVVHIGVGVGASIAVAWLSWRWIESPLVVRGVGDLDHRVGESDPVAPGARGLGGAGSRAGV